MNRPQKDTYSRDLNLESGFLDAVCLLLAAILPTNVASVTTITTI